MASGLVDFHCHLDLYPDHAAAFSQCENEGIYTLAVTTTPRAWPRNRDLAGRTHHVHAALGLHPQLAAERAAELSLWEEYLPQAEYVGEVGLDAGPRFFRSLDIQKQVFERVLKLCANAGGKILTVHSVRATGMVLDLIEAHFRPTRGRVVLHWFSGSQADARRAVDLGCYFSVNAEMLRNERQRRLALSLPIDRLLTETDGPFTRLDGRPTCPPDITVVVDMLARLRSMFPAELAAVIRSNLSQLRREVGAWC